MHSQDIACPHCNESFRIDVVKYSGKNVRCKSCQGVILIPSASGYVEEPSESPQINVPTSPPSPSEATGSSFPNINTSRSGGRASSRPRRQDSSKRKTNLPIFIALGIGLVALPVLGLTCLGLGFFFLNSGGDEGSSGPASFGSSGTQTSVTSEYADPNSYDYVDGYNSGYRQADGMVAVRSAYGIPEEARRLLRRHEAERNDLLHSLGPRAGTTQRLIGICDGFRTRLNEAGLE